LISIISLCLNRFYFLSVLLSYELIIASNFFILILVDTFVSFKWIETVIYFLLVSVCEASLGLSLVVLSAYFYGGDYLKSISY
jgi:NADH:ubiquinone oxidoreductase subunit K